MPQFHGLPGQGSDRFEPPSALSPAGRAPFFQRPAIRLSLAMLLTVLFLGAGVWVSKGGYKRWRHPGTLATPAVPATFADVTTNQPSRPEARDGEPAVWDQGQILTDTEGVIAELALHYSPDLEAHLEPVLRDLFAKLPGGIRLQVCCASEEAIGVFVTRWGSQARAHGREVVLANLDRVLSLWARDRRVARQTPDYLPARVFVPTPLPLYESDKQSDLQIPSLLWPAGLVPGTTLVSFHLEGGNLVANQRHLFTGINVLLENEDKFDDEAGLERMLRRLFAREPVLLRDRRNLVPWVHADMYLTPVSETLVLLADPADGWERFRSSAGVSSGSSSADTPELLGGLGPESLVLDPVLRDSFEDIQGQLTELGYQVMRLPALVNAAEEWMVSYNNVLMERRDGKRIVYMPVYDLPALDAAAADVYRRLGFEVRMIDVTGVFQLGGAIRCVANVTRRLPAPETADADCATCLGPLHIFESPYARKAEAGDGTVRKISRGGDGARGGGVR